MTPGKTQKQIVQQHKAWARGLLVRALRRHDFIKGMPNVPQLTRDRVDVAVVDALAIAEEWGVVGDAVADEIEEKA